MLTFAIVFLSFNIFRLTQNRSCFGINGWACCDGYFLNQTTGQCQKCPLGYYLNNCLTKCSAPTYGEGCQSVCQCPIVSCHFATGCPQHDYTYTSFAGGDTARKTTFSLKVTTLNLTVSYRTNGHAFSADVSNNEVTKMTYLPTDTDLFKNDFFVQVVQIILSFIGIFVVVFTIFVFAYIYLKCFRKKTNEGEINKYRKNAQYKSLRFSSGGPESQTQPGPQEVDSQVCTYLTPVCKDKANSDICHSYENVEIVQETSFQRQQNRYKPANESSSTPDAGLANVYSEINQDNMESSSLDGAFNDNGNQEI
nr:uncharacterized protein LOC117688233 [Crassostrea gigas]